ncbi:MAG: OmpA family protein [Bacteroidetes bacterium]|nr:OmpA family protein [Bacteroidota bacterium]
MADGNFMLRDYVSSNSYYKKIVELDSVKHKNLNALYQYALTEKYLGHYETSRDNFQKFIKLAKDNEKFDDQRRSAGRESQGCDLGISLRDNKDVPEFKVTHLDENVNQPLTEFAPTLRDGNTLYYAAWTSDRVVMVNKHEHYADFSRIYVSQRNENTWTKGAMIAGGVNESSSHVGNAAISADGETMYYTQCLQDDYQRMRCDIYKSKLENNIWGAGAKLDSKVNAEGFTSTHPALGRNEAGEDVLYFSSDRNPGKGMDLFCAKINADGSMSKARSVGPAINTKGDEITPGYDFKTNTLYFSSNGQINIGGADVYKINASGGEWGQPQHLGMPINSSVDDMYYSWSDFDGEGYLVSNRGGGFGTKSETCCDDVYKVEKSRLYLAVKGFVQNMDSNMKTIDNALVTLYSMSEGKELKNVYATNGKYFFDLEKENDYQLVARKKGFEDYMKTISTKGKRQNDTMSFDFPLIMLPQMLSKVGERIGTVYWEFNKDYLTDGAPDTLNRVVGFMTNNPQYVLEVGSHTDAKGTEEYNLKLAQRRSDAVLRYLASKKIAKFRLESKAYGESKPVELNENPPGTDNPEGRTKNRRTEFVITQELTQQQIDDAIKAEKEAKSKPKKVAASAMSKVESKTTTAKPTEMKTETKSATKK